jgi:outer membrane receptor protein involved in Fe transport
MKYMTTLRILALFIVTSCFCATTVNAQMPGMGGRPGGGQQMNVGRFYGKIVDVNGKPIEAASVQLLQNKLDTATKKRKDVVVSGMLTTKKGEFSLENLNVMAAYQLKITAIGYKTITQKAAFELNMANARSGDMSSMLNAVDKDLGNIKVEVDAQTLKGVVVTASTPQLVMNIDRKVFNVEKNLTSVGGTAVDVMKNVPSVGVDIDGNVTLRNAAPQIFVDGRPSTLSLDQIPADAIASVEIITNPSAKFDASGGGSGILNIVLKKNRKAGYNGNVRASIDSRPRPSFGGDFNVKQGKVNFFANANLGFRKSLSWATSSQALTIPAFTASSNQSNAPINKGVFGFARFGMDYFLDNRNTLTFGGSFVRGQFKSNDYINIENRDTAYSNGTFKEEYGFRSTANTGNFRNLGATVSFKHNFAKAGKELTADVNFNGVKNDNTGNFESNYFNAFNNVPLSLPLFEQQLGGGKTKFLTAQTDYVNPISDKIKIEMGVRGAFRKFESFNYNFRKNNTNDPYTLLPGFTADYEFNDRVLAAYSTFSQKIKKFTYQVGLRIESSNYEGVLLTNDSAFSNEFPLSLFPSAFATYKINDKQDLQLNYSRKINRPNFFQLIPFYDYSDPLNISVGNPNLVPEFTNLIELGYQYQINKNHSILATAYGRNTSNLITRYQYRDKFPDKDRKDSVLISSFINANRTYTVGLELTSKDKITKWWDLTANLNLFNTTLEAGGIVGGGKNSQFSWFGKMNNTFKLPKNYSIQLSGDYQAKTILPASSTGGGGGGRGMGGMFGGGGGFGQTQGGAQGFIKPNYGVDIAIRKDFMKNNAASLTLQMNDIFRTKVNATVASTDFFVQENLRRRDPQVLRLNFAWRFGKMDVSLFKRKNMRGEMEGMQNATQGMGQ